MIALQNACPRNRACPLLEPPNDQQFLLSIRIADAQSPSPRHPIHSYSAPVSSLCAQRGPERPARATATCHLRLTQLSFLCNHFKHTTASNKPLTPAIPNAPAALQDDAGIPPLIIFGGGGFVGSHVCQEALRCGLPVTSVSRSGRPSNERDAWADSVTWECGDAMHPDSYRHLLSNCLGVVTCIGLISPSYADMLRVNGDANERIIAAAADAGVERLAYISAHDYNFPGDLWVMKGYFEGKRQAEAALRDRFPTGGAPPGHCHCRTPPQPPAHPAELQPRRAASQGSATGSTRHADALHLHTCS